MTKKEAKIKIAKYLGFTYSKKFFSEPVVYRKYANIPKSEKITENNIFRNALVFTIPELAYDRKLDWAMVALNQIRNDGHRVKIDLDEEKTVVTITDMAITQTGGNVIASSKMYNGSVIETMFDALTQFVEAKHVKE